MGDNDQPTTTPAGWYPDGEGTLRWWDGTAWTQHTHTPDSLAPATQDAGSEPAPHFGHKVKDGPQICRELQPHLVDGEDVRAIFKVARINPVADLLIITNIRVISALRAEISDGPRRFAMSAKVTGFDISKSMGGLNGTHISLTQDGFGDAKVGTLRHKEDETALRTHLQAAVETEPDEFSDKAEDAVGDLLMDRSRDSLVAAGMPEDATDEEEYLLREGDVPLQAAKLMRPILTELDEAEEAAAAGDIEREEAHLTEAVRIAGTAGLLHARKVRAWVRGEIEEAVAHGELRVGMTVLGTVNGEGWLTDENEVTIANDRILYGGKGYPVDQHVAAAVELNGQLLESSRPTMTRMALGSILPGSALLIGLAAPKTTTTDTRTAHLVIVHPLWRIVVPIGLGRVPEVRALASQINAISKSLETPAGRADQNSALPVPALAEPLVAQEPAPDGMDARLDRLERIADLLSRGVIDEAEATRLRAEILNV